MIEKPTKAERLSGGTWQYYMADKSLRELQARMAEERETERKAAYRTRRLADVEPARRWHSAHE